MKTTTNSNQNFTISGSIYKENKYVTAFITLEKDGTVNYKTSLGIKKILSRAEFVDIWKKTGEMIYFELKHKNILNDKSNKAEINVSFKL